MERSPHRALLLEGSDPARPPLVLLHGTDGGERDLLGLAERLAPGAGTLAVRGAVRTPGGYAFFRRRPDRSIDDDDIVARTTVLAQFIGTALGSGPGADRPVLVGFSNGAIAAAALVMTEPAAFSAAVLFRPLTPFPRSAALVGLPVLVLDGALDHRRARGDGRRLGELLTAVGARVTHRELDVGHAITDEDVLIARTWLDDLHARR